MRGMIAPRAEDAIANAADCTATRPKITGTLSSSSSVWTSSASVTSPRAERGPQVERRAVDGVGDRAAVQAEDDDRHQPGQPDEPDRQRRVRERVHLHRYRDLGEHRADERGALADQQPAVGGDAEGPGVDRMAPKCGAQTACFLDRIGGVEHLLIERGVGRRALRPTVAVGHGASRSIVHPSSARR